MSGLDTKPTSGGSAIPEPDDERVTFTQFGDELRRLRRRKRETQAKTSDAVNVSRGTLAQWETGRHLPSSDHARLLDLHLGSGSHLFDLAEQARLPLRPRASSAVDVPAVFGTSTVLQVFRAVGRGLVEHLIVDDQGKPTGWRHNLQQSQQQTALSTAYGIKAMLVVGEPHVDLHALETSLRSMREPHGGWFSRSQGQPRPEVTATVLDALFRIGTPIPVEEALGLLESLLDDFSRTRPFILSSVLQTVVRLRPDSPLTHMLIDSLLAARQDFNGVLLWPEKVEAGLVKPDASLIHTARAVTALQAALEVHHRADLHDAVGTALDWIVNRPGDDDGVTEQLTHPNKSGQSQLAIRHFTSAWVAQALAQSTSAPADRTRRALRTLFERYVPETGLWAWGNGDLPIWMTHDAVAALRCASLAFSSSEF